MENPLASTLETPKDRSGVSPMEGIEGSEAASSYEEVGEESSTQENSIYEDQGPDLDVNKNFEVGQKQQVSENITASGIMSEQTISTTENLQVEKSENTETLGTVKGVEKKKQLSKFELHEETSSSNPLDDDVIPEKVETERQEDEHVNPTKEDQARLAANVVDFEQESVTAEISDMPEKNYKVTQEGSEFSAAPSAISQPEVSVGTDNALLSSFTDARAARCTEEKELVALEDVSQGHQNLSSEKNSNEFISGSQKGNNIVAGPVLSEQTESSGSPPQVEIPPSEKEDIAGLVENADSSEAPSLEAEAAQSTSDVSTAHLVHNDDSNDQDPRAALRKELQKRRPSVYRVRKICREGLNTRIPNACRSDVWQLLLGTESKDRFLLDDSIRDTKQDLENQRVIRVDAQRTRADVAVFRTEEMQALVSRLLTFYCKRKGIRYKQGLNEVLAPFIMLRENPQLPDGIIFNLFYAFIERFLPHAYVHEDFHALQCSFRLFRLLLLYHDPELCNFLDTHNLSPELYATPWFLTLFARNVPLPVLYQLWDTYLLEEDDGGPHLHMFIALALTLENRMGILSTHPSDLPIYLTSVLTPNATAPEEGVEELAQSTPFLYRRDWMDKLIIRARHLRCQTPALFTDTLSSALLSPKLPSLTFLERLENQSCLHMSAGQLLGLMTNRDRMRDETEFLLRVVDCRSRAAFEQEHLIGSLHLDPELLNLPELLAEALEELANRLELADMRLHLVVVGSSALVSPDSSRAASPPVVPDADPGRRRASSGNVVDISSLSTSVPAEEDQNVVLFVLHAIQRSWSQVSILDGGWNTVTRESGLEAVVESGASIDELVPPERIFQKTRPVNTWREAGLDTLRGALSMTSIESFGSHDSASKKFSADTSQEGNHRAGPTTAANSTTWYQRLGKSIGEAPLGALFSTSTMTTAPPSSKSPLNTSPGASPGALSPPGLTNTPQISTLSRKHLETPPDAESQSSAQTALPDQGSAQQAISSAASAFMSRVANRYFQKSDSGENKVSESSQPDLLVLALSATDNESRWIDLEEWTSQTTGTGANAKIFHAARLTTDEDGRKRSTECIVAVTSNRFIELRTHPDRDSFACVQEYHDLVNLIKITSKKKRREIVFHFKSGTKGVKQRAFLISGANDCIELVKERFADLAARPS